MFVVSSAFAQTQITAKSGNVNIRNIPSTKDTATEKTRVVGTINDKETYTVEDRQEVSGKTWYKINEGWVAGWLVSEVKDLSIHGDGSSSSDDSSYDDSSSSDSATDTMDSSASSDDSVYDETGTGDDDSGIDDVAGDDEGNE